MLLLCGGCMLFLVKTWLQLVPCTRSMLEGSLLQALQTEGPQYEQVRGSEL